jgi:hypothetical protein
MSDVPPFEPIVPVAAPAPEVEAAVPAVADVPPPSSAVPSTPYRLAPATPFVVPSGPPIVGASLYVYGYLLWAFVVVGALTTSYNPEGHGFLLGETAAVLGVMAASAWAWIVVLRRTLSVRRGAVSVVRCTVVGGVAAFAWVLTLFASAAAGKAASRNIDGAMTFFLLALSIGCALGGRRLAGLHVRTRTPQRQMIDGIFWATGALLTCLVLGELGS